MKKSYTVTCHEDIMMIPNMLGALADMNDNNWQFYLNLFAMPEDGAANNRGAHEFYLMMKRIFTIISNSLSPKQEVHLLADMRGYRPFYDLQKRYDSFVTLFYDPRVGDKDIDDGENIVCSYFEIFRIAYFVASSSVIGTLNKTFKSIKERFLTQQNTKNIAYNGLFQVSGSIQEHADVSKRGYEDISDALRDVSCGIVIAGRNVANEIHRPRLLEH